MSAKITYTGEDGKAVEIEGLKHPYITVSETTSPVDWTYTLETVREYQLKALGDMLKMPPITHGTATFDYSTETLTYEKLRGLYDTIPILSYETRQSIERALTFAKRYLEIKAVRFVQMYEVYRDTHSYSMGHFDPDRAKMFYNGEPSLETVFHEAVHFKQWELDKRGFKSAYLDEHRRNGYRDCSYEVEARSKAADMERAYAEERVQRDDPDDVKALDRSYGDRYVYDSWRENRYGREGRSGYF